VHFTDLSSRSAQQLSQMQNMKAAAQNGQMMPGGNQMERSGSQMENRTGSPGSGDAPSPKRQRLDGGMQPMNQGRPGQPGQMQQGNQVGPTPDNPSSTPALETVKEMLRARDYDPDQIAPQQLLKLSFQPTNVQTQSVETYASHMKQNAQQAMNGVIQSSSNVHKGIPPNMGPNPAQGSPLSQQGMDGTPNEFYANANANGNARLAMQGNAAAAAAAGQGNNGGNHALQDYQMQLMLLEQQNKKRLLMARQEQDSMQHPSGQNGNYPPGMSPPGSQRSGPSPTPNDVQRGEPNAAAESA
jgi:hypothetical protein